MGEARGLGQTGRGNARAASTVWAKCVVAMTGYPSLRTKKQKENVETEKAAISEESIHQMVHQFYDEVREDPCLGPIFERRLHGQWPEHLARMCDFWSSVLLASGRFQGNPRETHSTLSNSGVRPAHFERWLYLFKGVIGQIFTAEAAGDIYQRATRMRHVLEPVTVKSVFAETLS